MRRFLPFLSWFPLSRESLKADLLAGIAVALVLVPQSMAYAQLAGMPAHYGLYASLLPVAVGALWGSSRQLATGPVAMVSLLTGSTLAQLAPPGGPQFVAYAIVLALMVGVLQLALGLARLGAIVNFLSHPVIAGFTNAAAIIIALSQLNKLLGVPMGRSEHFLADVIEMLAQAGQAHWPTLGIGCGAILVILLCRRYAPRWPGVLIAVALGTLVSWATGFERNASADAIFRVNIATRNSASAVNRVLASSYSEYFPALSPDSQAIAFVSDRTGSPQLFVADAEYGELRQVTREPIDTLGRPRWSADQQWLGYAQRAGERWTVQLARVLDSARIEIAGDWESVHHVEFSGDGAWVYFDARIDGVWQIMRRAVAGDGPVLTVATNSYMPTRLLVLHGERNEFAWLSPDGGLETLSSPCAQSWNRQGWAPTGNWLYCVFGTARENFALYRHAWSENKLNRMAALPRGFPLLGLSVAEDGSYALLGKGLIAAGADVMLVDLPR